MTETVEPMSIRAFSSLTRLSVRMLRHYHQHAVLVPAHVDDSGYRWYARDQFAHALLIRDLRDAGFTVSAMAALLAARDIPVLEQALITQRAVLEAEEHAARQRLRHIDRMLHTLRGHIMNSIEIQRRNIPAMTVVTYRGTVPTYADEGRLWERLMPEIGRQGIEPTGPGGVFENDPTYVDENPDLTVFVPVAPGTRIDGPAEVVHVPEQDVVVARVIGPYDQLNEAHTRITTFLGDNDLHDAEPEPEGLAGKVFNIYLTDPTTAEESELVTDVHRPVR